MNMLIINENAMNIFTDVMLLTAYLFIVFCGIYVISTKNPIFSVLYLILLFSIVALYLMQVTAYFIGLAYLLVYVGAVSILFLFILMLINIRTSELVTDNNNSIPLSISIITTFVVMFETLGISNSTNNITNILFNEDRENVDNYILPKTNIYSIDNNIWDTVITTISHINNIGNTIYTSYPLLLLMISIILLLSMIGSIIITVKR